MMRKINIGAGPLWQFEDWEVLDNVPGKYTDIKKHYGKCWDSKLPSDSYDVIFVVICWNTYLSSV